jgi:hypothetical protein
MQLSAKQFAQILQQLDSLNGEAPPAGSDKRRSARVALKQRATIVPYISGAPGQGVGVEVCDFSPRGLRFLHSAAVKRGEQFVLQLPQQSGEPVSILCTVVHCKTTSQGPFSIGAEFTCALRNGKATKAVRNDPARGERERKERSRIAASILD